MIKKILCFLFLIVFSSSIFGQKVALVLSGGGAKGLTHIGVIKALEENNIPIDYIAGTSMGAIIGCLYAIGYTTDEMEKLVTSPEFQIWSTGKIQENYVYYFKKKDENASLINVRFTGKDSTGGIRPILPTNLIPTHQMDFAFLQLMAGPTAASKRDFNRLFVPFRCIASDVYGNKAMVLKNGDLGSAVRASMTFPFYFKAITIDGHLLFDGGIYNNFPWDVVSKEFKPDIIIGSKCASNSAKPDESNIILQLENMIMTKTNYNLPDSLGILIETKFTDVNLLDFQKANEIIAKGYNETYAHIDEIKSRISRRVDNDSLNLKRAEFKKSEPALIFKNIFINGLNTTQREYVRNSISHKVDTFTLNQFKKEYFKLLADARIASIYPNAYYNDSTKFYDLYLNVKKQGAFELQAGGNISSSTLNEGYLGFAYNYLSKISNYFSGNFYLGKFYNSFQIKDRIDLPSHTPVFFDYVTNYNRFDYFNSYSDPFYDDMRPYYLIQNEVNFKGDFGIPASINSVLKGGIGYTIKKDEYFQITNYKKEDKTDITHFNFFNINFKYDQNTLNITQYPTDGKRILIRFNYLIGKEKNYPGSTSLVQDSYFKNRNWLNLNLIYDRYFCLNSMLNLGLYAEGNVSNQPFFNNYFSTMANLPSFQPIPQSNCLLMENYRAKNFAGIGIKPIFKFSNFCHFRMEEYVFQPFRIIKQDENFKAISSNGFKHHYFISSASLIFPTSFGPLSLSFNYFDKQNKKYYFLFNFGYILFNERSTN